MIEPQSQSRRDHLIISKGLNQETRHGKEKKVHQTSADIMDEIPKSLQSSQEKVVLGQQLHISVPGSVTNIEKRNTSSASVRAKAPSSGERSPLVEQLYK
ncbi:unnamed protein product [Ceratitis capitata]|uniref:(Mediterranean fruit fly) hypothetical protein n=1 Tax=Ceratitis capitata TaxID=7213 RepID=A0A811UCI0_CERCA|nr:unnamed protein product [Ceratitis capitata]